MKRTIIAALGITLIAGTLLQSGQAEAGARSYGYMDMKSNRAFVPIRYLSEQLKYDVKWDPNTKGIEVSKGEDKVSFTVGQKKAKVNDTVKEMDAVPFREGGTTYVPIRFVSDAMKLQLEWDKSGSALIFRNGQAEAAQKLPVISTERKISASTPIKQKHQTFAVGSRRISATIVEIDLLHPNIQLGIGIANGKTGSVDSLKHMAKVNGAKVAMNGTFFDAYTKSSVKVPYGYIVNKGKMVHKSSGDKRSALIFTEDNQVEIISGEAFPERFEEGGVYGGLQAGPRLVTNGKVTVNPVKEGFKDPKILTNGGARSAVGVTKDHKLILMTTSSATIPQLANAMKQAGAYDAMNLDGGASSGLYYNGKYLTSPGREISNALLVL
ncbi:phosphodiester glycosidase family protein [Paenibacillus apiarius]|uniref:Phosphodiester glycosidase family protein n=1 Tax=Paenibacillus apiarius TaxID=46240 RepID=A0ABT4DRT0_9BACL|nr:phosphodiester glycosidase family protein [Paenibacillus apiarius]MCY9512974.1 phosphodiester glycosidase family protein [Paenibacillus apiarius]MCY9518958.1 phosphodiester glycosidase family protein [Paenibacillus apiarius]MCY9550767.1 phosphodiester glycosidase family protein [Paenibacillus apiarius]MCY9559799.1 phosphodiester glycosidase family protein [Paenibacillus apiarius]MCY9682042.1 phosphodiester glycosidase family protein [Paenibacillus apiarius]